MRTADDIRFLVLQHPQEARNPLSTVPLLPPLLPEVTVRVGLSWRSLSAALGEKAEPREWGVLYLGSLKEHTKLPEVPLQIVPKKGAPPPLESLKGIVVIDGNWKQAKSMWWRNSWFLKLHRLVLRPEAPSEYAPLRKQPRRDCLSTLESVAACLEVLTPGAPEIATLREAFRRHVEQPRVDEPVSPR